MQEACLVLVMPDGMRRGLTGNVLTRISETGLEIAATKVVKVSRSLAEAQYNHLRDKPFFEELVEYIMGEVHGYRKVLALVYYGESAIRKIKSLAGSTNPEEADFVSIRGQYGRVRSTGLHETVIHVSANAVEAEREIKLWFRPNEIVFKLYPTEEIIVNDSKGKVWKK